MKTDRAKKRPQQASQLPERIRPELNIEKWSIWQPANSRAAPKPRTLKREVILPDGQRLIAKLKVAPTTEGNLTTGDQRVYYALVKLWEKRGRCESFTPFSLRRLAQILKRRWSPQTKDALTRSLLRLRLTGFIWEKAYTDGSNGSRFGLLDTFNILCDLKIVRREGDGHVTTEAGYFRFHEAIVTNLLASHTKPVLFDVVLSFKSEIAQILYTHLDLVLSDKDRYERRTAELYGDLGLEGETYRYPSKRQEKLEPALRELEGVPLTTGTIIRAKLEKTRDGKDYKLIVQKGKAAKSATEPERRAEEILPLPVKDKRAAQAEELVRHFHRVFHGAEEAIPTVKSLDQAASLIARLGFEKARHIVDFAHREAPKTRHQIKTFGGIIQYATQAQVDFDKSRQDREQQRRAGQANEERRQREAEEQARDEARRAEAKRRWVNLSPEEQADVEKEAFEKGNRWFLDRYNHCKRAGLQEQAEKWRWLIIEAHLIALPGKIGS